MELVSVYSFSPRRSDTGKQHDKGFATLPAINASGGAAPSII
jgi:hypothetical protein